MEKPEGVYEFPLTEGTARRIMNDLAENHTNRISVESTHKEKNVRKRSDNFSNTYFTKE